MISKRDVQLGKIALKEGFITKDQLTKCLALKKKLAKDKGKKVALGALLLKKGYLEKEQLEECVRLHNAALEKKEGGGERKKRRTKRSKKSATSQTVEAASEDATASEEGSVEAEPLEAKKPAKKKKRKSKSEDDEAEGETATATATKTESKRAGSKSKRSRRSRRSSKDAARGKSKRKGKKDAAGASDEGDLRDSAVESAVEAVDPAIFASAQESDVETETRRLIACPDCGKRYKVKRNQVGKRFNCRRCKHRIKVPKDLFQRQSELRSAVEVEEFVLGSGSGIVEEDSGELPAAKKGASKGSVEDAAAKAAAAVAKVGKQASIAELAEQATKHRPKPLTPKAKFGAKELATMLVLAGILGGMCFGAYHWFVVRPAEARRLARLKDHERKLALWKGPFQGLLALAEEAAQKEDARQLANVLLKVERDLPELKRKHLGASSDLLAKAEEVEQQAGLEAKAREWTILAGKLYIAQGGARNIAEGLRLFERALEMEGVGEEVSVEVAKVRIDQRRYAETAEDLAEFKSQTALALRGLAWELGGSAQQAEKAYKQLDDPLKGVLVARAWLAEGRYPRATQEISNASGLEGVDQAAAKLVEARAFEGRRDLGKASRAYDMAVASGKESPIPLAARAEFYLRKNDPQAALKDAQSSRKIGVTPRGLLALGDAQLALLQIDKALATYREAVAATPREPDRLVAEAVDALAAPLPLDYRVAAQSRMALVLAAQGKTAEAQSEIELAVNRNPFDPYGLTTMVFLGILQESVSGDDYIDRALSLCNRAGKDNERLPGLASGWALFVYGAQRLAKSRYEEALKALDEAVKYDPVLRGPASVLAGRALMATGLRTKAQRRFLEAATAEGAQPGTKLLSERVSKVSANTIAVFERNALALLARNPYHARAYLLRGRARLRAEKAEGALADLNKACELNPMLREAFLTRALMHLKQLPLNLRNVNQGGNDVQTAMGLEGPISQTKLFYAQALWQWSKGEIKPTLETLERCLAQDESFAPAYELQATVYENKGEKDKATRARERFESLSKGS